MKKDKSKEEQDARLRICVKMKTRLDVKTVFREFAIHNELK